MTAAGSPRWRKSLMLAASSVLGPPARTPITIHVWHPPAPPPPGTCSTSRFAAKV